MIKYGMLTTGDRETLAREAEAIVALIRQRPSSTMCKVCGTENTKASRFCRRCGAPLEVPIPAELEVLRLTAGTRATQRHIVVGFTILALLFLYLVAPFVILTLSRRGTVLVIVSWLVFLSGWLTMFLGIGRLHRLLNRKGTSTALPRVEQLPSTSLPMTSPYPNTYLRLSRKTQQAR